jgi:hypothetical protein
MAGVHNSIGNAREWTLDGSASGHALGGARAGQGLTMATTARESLRELCSDYFYGLIPADAYRRRRAVLLDDIVLGSKQPAEDEEERTQPQPTVTVGELPSAPPRAPQTSAAWHRNLLYAGAAGIVLLLVVLIVFLLTDLSALT